MTVHNYDFKNRNKVIVNSRVIGGYDDDGGVEYSYDNEEDYSAANGADSETTVSRTNNPLGEVTITLKESSDGYKYLLGLCRLQDASAPAGLLTVSYLHTDLDNGELVTENEGVLKTRGMPSKGREAGTREVVIILPNLKNNYRIQ